MTLVGLLVGAAARSVGPNWLAVHLPIEHDWWHSSDYCMPRGREAFTRRCYSPSEVAEVTRELRERLRPTGVVLLYAADKVHSSGPIVCPSLFHANATHRLQLPKAIPYTLRNAAEQFFAAVAPAGFVGNSFSTFSKGVALMRTQQQQNQRAAAPSYAYDCGPLEHPLWTMPKGRRSVSLAHPGFALMRSVEPARCGFAT